MSAQRRFDIFLAHNSKDKSLIEEIFQSLKDQGLNPWLDKDQILGGDLILDELQSAIKNSKCAAFFIGKHGLGKWQQDEQRALIQQSIKTGSRVIPVILPHVSDELLESADLLFLSGRCWLRLENYADTKNFISDLVKSINKIKNHEQDLFLSGQERGSEITIEELLVRKGLLEKRLKDVESEIERAISSLRSESIDPSLDTALKWLNGRAELARKYGNSAVKGNLELRTKLNGELAELLYIDIDSYLKRVYCALLAEDESLLYEPPPPEFVNDEQYNFSPHDLDCMYANTFQIIKQNIPPAIEPPIRTKLEAYIDQLVRRLRLSWHLCGTQGQSDCYPD